MSLLPGCGMGDPNEPCGQPPVAAFAVGTYPNSWILVDKPPANPGVLLLCRRHATTPLVDVADLPSPAEPEPPMPTGQAFLDQYSTPGLASPALPTPATEPLDAQERGPCTDCGRPFSPTHDRHAPGPTVRHPYRPNRHPDGAR